MKRFQTRRRVPHSAEQMFDLVADVDRYPEFVPLCERLRVRSRKVVDGRDVLITDMTMGYKAIHETITCEVVLLREENRIDVRYLDGPFSRMENRWSFQPHDDGGCTVDFYIAYELKSVMLGFLVSQLFDRAFQRFAGAFETRARRIYARPNRSAPAVGKAATVSS
ncbi:MAG: type II toxin-antitoxin system RatA family toxin [Pseudomonadota bacterium]